MSTEQLEALARRNQNQRRRRIRAGGVARWSALRPFLSVNRDLFLRTVVLTIALAGLTRLSAERGPVVLAANGIIYQLFVFTALLLDERSNARATPPPRS